MHHASPTTGDGMNPFLVPIDEERHARYVGRLNHFLLLLVLLLF